jgi:hypothetical protein
LPRCGPSGSAGSRHSWITSAGAVLDAAALAHSTIEGGREASAALCLRAGYLALRNIAAYFRVGLPFDPHYPEVDIAVTREDYDIACELLAQAGIALRADRDQAWLDFAGWRVNYDLPLLALSALTVAPEAPWSSDRDAEMLPPYAVARAPLRRDE